MGWQMTAGTIWEILHAPFLPEITFTGGLILLFLKTAARNHFSDASFKSTKPKRAECGFSTFSAKRRVRGWS